MKIKELQYFKTGYNWIIGKIFIWFYLLFQLFVLLYVIFIETNLKCKFLIGAMPLFGFSIHWILFFRGAIKARIENKYYDSRIPDESEYKERYIQSLKELDRARLLVTIPSALLGFFFYIFSHQYTSPLNSVWAGYLMFAFFTFLLSIGPHKSIFEDPKMDLKDYDEKLFDETIQEMKRKKR